MCLAKLSSGDPAAGLRLAVGWRSVSLVNTYWPFRSSIQPVNEDFAAGRLFSDCGAAAATLTTSNKIAERFRID